MTLQAHDSSFGVCQRIFELSLEQTELSPIPALLPSIKFQEKSLAHTTETSGFHGSVQTQFRQHLWTASGMRATSRVDHCRVSHA